MPKVYPSGTNTFVPSTEATNNLVVDFSRNPKKFKLPEYMQYVPIKKPRGLYIEMTVEQAGRILGSDAEDIAWPYGADAPSGEGSEEGFEFKAVETRRFAPAFRLPQEADENADWKLLAQFARINAQRAMTARTLRAVTRMINTSNYPTGHYSAVDSIAGVTGRWNLSTTVRMDIKRSLDYAAEQIMIATLGAVQPEDLIVVMGPRVAQRISVTQEIRDHIKQSPAAEKTILGNLGPANNFGMPERLYDYKLVVENAVKVTSRKGATASKSFVMPSTAVVMMARPGGLEGIEGSPSFSTWTMFFKEEMTVESKHDIDNRRHLGRTVDDYGIHATAPISGFVFTDPISA